MRIEAKTLKKSTECNICNDDVICFINIQTHGLP